MLQMGNFSSLDGILYCKPHFEQFFRESGSFKIAQGSQKPNLVYQNLPISGPLDL